MKTHVVFAAAALFAAGAAAARAEAVVQVTVTVVDGTGAPVRHAEITAADGSVLARTGDAGVAVVNAERGAVLSARFGDLSSASVVVRDAALRLTLRPVIGRVSARPAADNVARDDARSLLAGDPAAGLAYTPQRRAPSEGGSSRFRINGVAIDLPLPGGGDAAPVAPDLLESATPVRAADGSIDTDYHLAEPSARAAQRVEAGVSANDGALWRATRTGPGFAVAFAHGRDDGTLAGRTFRDASGITYPHDTAAVHDTASAVFNRRLRSSTLAFIGSARRDAENVVATTEAGPVPDGYGPGNRSRGTGGIAITIWNAPRGRDTLSAVDVHYGGMRENDLSALRVAGDPVADASWGYAYAGRYDSVGVTRVNGATSIALKLASTRSSSTGRSGGVSSTTSWARDTVHLSLEGAGGGAGIGVERVAGAFNARSVDLDASLRRRFGAWAVRASGYAGAAQTDVASYVRSFGLSSPQTASFTCDPRSATVVAPSVTSAAPPHSVNLSLDVERTGARGSIRAGGFATQIRNALVQVDADGTFAGDYLAQLAGANASACGGVATASLQALVHRWESVPVVRQREWFVQGERRVGAVRLLAFVERFSDVVAVAPPALAGLRSDLIAGAQIPHVAPLRAAFAASFPVRGATLALGARAFSGNNAYNASGHVVIDAAAQLPVGAGALIFSAQNVFAAGGGALSSSGGAVPLATTLGETIPTLRRPVPSSWSLRYVLSHGRH